MLKSSALHIYFFPSLLLFSSFQPTSAQIFENLGSPFNYLEDLVKDTFFQENDQSNNQDLNLIQNSDQLKAKHQENESKNNGISDKDLSNKEKALEKYLAEIEAEDVKIYMETGKRPGDSESFVDPEFPDETNYTDFAEFSKLVPENLLIDDEEDHIWAENLVDNKWANRRMYNDIMREKGDRIIEDRLTFRSASGIGVFTPCLAVSAVWAIFGAMLPC